MENIKKVINGITIEVNYYLELMGLLITLSDEDKLYPRLFMFDDNNSSYVQKIKNRFGYLKEHKVVLKFIYLKEKYFLHYDKPIELALGIDDNFAFKKGSNYKFKDNEEIKDFLRELKDFSEEIGFEDFYLENKDIYLKWIDSMVSTYEDNNILDVIANYCGEEYKNYQFYTNLIPFETNGGYGVLLDKEAHNCILALSKTVDNNLFYLDNHLALLPLSIHEYLHSIINPITSKYKVFTGESAYIYDKDNEIKSYRSDDTMANETIIRAMVIRIYHSIDDNFNEEERLLLEESKGFKLVRLVYGKLLEYENNREKYPNIDSFYMNIAKEIIENKDKKRVL